MFAFRVRGCLASSKVDASRCFSRSGFPSRPCRFVNVPSRCQFMLLAWCVALRSAYPTMLTCRHRCLVRIFWMVTRLTLKRMANSLSRLGSFARRISRTRSSFSFAHRWDSPFVDSQMPIDMLPVRATRASTRKDFFTVQSRRRMNRTSAAGALSANWQPCSPVKCPSRLQPGCPAKGCGLAHLR